MSSGAARHNGARCYIQCSNVDGARNCLGSAIEQQSVRQVGCQACHLALWNCPVRHRCRIARWSCWARIPSQSLYALRSCGPCGACCARVTFQALCALCSCWARGPCQALNALCSCWARGPCQALYALCSCWARGPCQALNALCSCWARGPCQALYSLWTSAPSCANAI